MPTTTSQYNNHPPTVQAPGLSWSWTPKRRWTRATRSSGCHTCAGQAAALPSGLHAAVMGAGKCLQCTCSSCRNPAACTSHLLRPLLSWAFTANHPCPIIAPSACSSCPVLRCSYQGMGTALIECKQGCTCEPTKLDGTWNRRASLFWSTRVFVSFNNTGCPWHAHYCAACGTAAWMVRQACVFQCAADRHPPLPVPATHSPVTPIHLGPHLPAGVAAPAVPHTRHCPA